MINKCLEIRDRATCIPVLAIKMSGMNYVQKQYLWRCGYSPDGNTIILMKLNDQAADSDAYGWQDRTMQTAHIYIEKNFDNLSEGDVVDVQVILGEENMPAAAEIAPKNITL